MRYAIISIDNSRADNKANTRRVLSDWDEVVGIEYVHRGNLEEALSRYGKYQWWDSPKVGEIGIWYSNVAVWHYMIDHNVDQLAVFEDDAILVDTFPETAYKVLDNTPTDFDYISMWIPPNQSNDYYYRVKKWSHNGWPLQIRGKLPVDQSHFFIGNYYSARMYQGYGCIAMIYSIDGARNLLARLEQEQMCETFDCFLSSRSRVGLNGYAIHPAVSPVVSHDFERETTIHNTERLK